MQGGLELLDGKGHESKPSNISTDRSIPVESQGQLLLQYELL